MPVVGLAQEDVELVGHVHVGNADGLVVAHLLGELVRELDRLHAGLEGAPEAALDKAFQFLFSFPEDAHRGVPPARHRSSKPTARVSRRPPGPHSRAAARAPRGTSRRRWARRGTPRTSPQTPTPRPLSLIHISEPTRL